MDAKCHNNPDPPNPSEECASGPNNKPNFKSSYSLPRGIRKGGPPE